MEKVIVSIIIPTYNRSLVLGTTLDSVLSQSFQNWECLVIDDGSTDYTFELMEYYCELDSRFRYYLPYKNQKKGANACRNFGFDLSKGDYIQWFDSDDLMMPEFLEKKINFILEHSLDFVISKSINFKDPNPLEIIDGNEYFYNFDEFKITHYNYAVQNINWLTPDFLGKRTAVSNFQFNEGLTSAQERNFFTKVTAHTTNARVLNDYLTLRRIHSRSIQSQLHSDTNRRRLENFQFLFETWKDLKNLNNDITVLDYFFYRAVDHTLSNKAKWNQIFILTLEYSKKNFYSAFWFLLYHTSFRFTRRGNIFKRKLRKEERKLSSINTSKKVIKDNGNVLINILTRTSGRPIGFKKCYESIQNQSYKNIRHIVSFDHLEDLEYLDKYNVERIKVIKEEIRKEHQFTDEVFEPYNLYCNNLLDEVKEGWIIFLDDDDMLIDGKILEYVVNEIKKVNEDTLIVAQTSYPDGKLLPEKKYMLERKIEKFHIDTGCVIFHHKYKNAARWDEWRAADFRFIKQLSSHVLKQHWVMKTFIQKNNFGDLGNRNDIFGDLVPTKYEM